MTLDIAERPERLAQSAENIGLASWPFKAGTGALNLRNGAVFDDAFLQRVHDEARGLTSGGHVFVEQREDLTLDGAGVEPVRTRLAAASGVARCAAGASTFRSDENPVSVGVLDVDAARRWTERLRSIAGPDSRVTYVATDQRVGIGRAGVPAVQDRRRGARVRLEVRLRQGGSAVADVVWRPGKEPDPDDLARSTLARARARGGAVPPPEGTMPIVLAPGVAGIIVHELVGHPLEEDAVSRGGSWLSGRTDEVASRILRVVDDPRRGRVPWKFDDEGEAVVPISLLEAGRIAQRLGSGRFRRSGFPEPARPRMGCTFVTTGSATPEEALGGVERGLYVRRLEAASVDPRSGRATFRVVDADLIRDGAIADAVHACLLSMTAAQVLRGFECIADDLEFDTCVGTCFKDGQPLAVSVGAPTCRLGLVRVHA